MSREIKISGHDPIEVLNAKLKKKYKATVFDFAYLLAIALNQEFSPRQYPGSGMNELDKLLKILTTTKRKLSKYEFLRKIIREIDKGIRYLETEGDNLIWGNLNVIKEKKNLLLLWSQVLIKGYRRPLEDPPNTVMAKNILTSKGKIALPFKVEITSKTVENIDWNDYLTLLGWFYTRLARYSYSSFIRPKKNKQEEKESAKSLLEKQFLKYEHPAFSALWTFKWTQEYFLPTERIGQKIELLKGRGKEAGPIIEVCFFPNRIETARLVEEGILNRTTTIMDKKMKSRKMSEEKTERRWPAVIFGNKPVFEIKNYSPPSFSSSNGFDQLTKDIYAENKPFLNGLRAKAKRLKSPRTS